MKEEKSGEWDTKGVRGDSRFRVDDREGKKGTEYEKGCV